MGSAKKGEGQQGATAVAEPPKDLGGEQGERILSLEEQLAQLRSQFATLQAEGSRSQADTMRLVGDGPASMAGSDIDEFCKRELAPTVYFAMNWRVKLMLVHGKTEYIRERDERIPLPPLAVEFNRWEGVGSELREPGTTNQLLPWGECDIAELPNVGEGQQYSVEEVRKRLESHPDFTRRGLVVTGKVAQERLRSHYKEIRAIQAAHAEREALTVNQTPAQIKAGLVG